MATPEELLAARILALQTGIADITLAMGMPERQVTLDGQTITYRSIADMVAARGVLQAELYGLLAQSTSAPPRPRRVYAVYGGRGYSGLED